MKRFLVCLIAIAILLPASSLAWDDCELKQDTIKRQYPRQHIGKRYKYDLLNPGDQLRYEMDLNLHMREEMDLQDQLRRGVDPWDGRFRGPAKDWEIDP